MISIVCLAALVKLDAHGRTIEDARLAIAGIGPMPLPPPRGREFLRGAPLIAAQLEQAADMPVDAGRLAHAAGIPPRRGARLHAARADQRRQARRRRSGGADAGELEAAYA